MNLQRQLSNALSNPAARHFVASLNKQEKTFRRALTTVYRDRSKLLKQLVASSLPMRDAIEDYVADQYQTRPTLVFSTDVHLTKQQRTVLRTIRGWNVYATVYNAEEQCYAVLLKNAAEGKKDPKSTVEVQKWGMLYPDGSFRTGRTMPIASVGEWVPPRTKKLVAGDKKGEHKWQKSPLVRLKHELPHEASESLVRQAEVNRNVVETLRGNIKRFTLNG